MIRREKPSKWRKVFRITKLTIFLVFCLIVANNNLHSPQIPESAPQSVHRAVQALTDENEAFASINEGARPKPKPSLVETHKERAVNWFYKKTSRVPRNMAEDVVSFITENVEPQLQPTILTLFVHESTGNPFEVSPKGAAGATQIMFRYWGKALIEEGLISEERDLFDYRKNILCCQYILKTLLAEEGHSMRKALLRYGDSGRYPDNVLRKTDDLTRSLTLAAVQTKETRVKHVKPKASKKKR